MNVFSISLRVNFAAVFNYRDRFICYNNNDKLQHRCDIDISTSILPYKCNDDHLCLTALAARRSMCLLYIQRLSGNQNRHCYQKADFISALSIDLSILCIIIQFALVSTQHSSGSHDTFAECLEIRFGICEPLIHYYVRCISLSQVFY